MQQLLLELNKINIYCLSFLFVILISYVIIILIIIHTNYRLIDSNAYYITLDVKQGDSSILILPNNKGNIMIDTGGGYNNDFIF